MYFVLIIYLKHCNMQLFNYRRHIQQKKCRRLIRRKLTAFQRGLLCYRIDSQDFYTPKLVSTWLRLRLMGSDNAAYI